jgi:hypothetical protein
VACGYVQLVELQKAFGGSTSVHWRIERGACRVGREIFGGMGCAQRLRRGHFALTRRVRIRGQKSRVRTRQSGGIERRATVFIITAGLPPGRVRETHQGHSWSCPRGERRLTQHTWSEVFGRGAGKASDLSDDIIDVRANVIFQVVPSFGLVADVDRTCASQNWPVCLGQPAEHPVCCGVL